MDFSAECQGHSSSSTPFQSFRVDEGGTRSWEVTFGHSLQDLKREKNRLAQRKHRAKMAGIKKHVSRKPLTPVKASTGLPAMEQNGDNATGKEEASNCSELVDTSVRFGEEGCSFAIERPIFAVENSQMRDSARLVDDLIPQIRVITNRLGEGPLFAFLQCAATIDCEYPIGNTEDVLNSCAIKRNQCLFSHLGSPGSPRRLRVECPCDEQWLLPAAQDIECHKDVRLMDILSQKSPFEQCPRSCESKEENGNPYRKSCRAENSTSPSEWTSVTRWIAASELGSFYSEACSDVIQIQYIQGYHCVEECPRGVEGLLVENIASNSASEDSCSWLDRFGTQSFAP